MGRKVVALVSVWMLSGCARTPEVSAAVMPSDPFEAVVRAALRDSGGYHPRFDPRPVLITEDNLIITRSSYPESAQIVVAQRLDILTRMHIDTVDASVLGFNERCASSIVPDSVRQASPAAYAGCPTVSQAVFTVGQMRPGSGPPASDGKLYDVNEERVPAGYWAVRVSRSIVGPGGANIVIFDYVVQNEQGRWRVVGKFPVYIVE